MSRVREVLLSLPAVVVFIGALTLGLILLGRYWNLGVATLFLLVVPIGIAVAYLWWYSTLPYEPIRLGSKPTPAPPPPVVMEEPFEDPVEEADRYDQARTTGGPEEEPAIVEDDASSEAPPGS